MEFSLKEYEGYNEAEILGLYARVGWTNYTANPQMLENAYRNSLKVIGAYVDEKLVGIVRVVGDGYSIVYIQDILILPEYQHRGIGKALMNKIFDIYKHVYQKTLMTDNTEKTIAFYKSVGLIMDTDMDCKAFMKMY